MAFSLLAGQNKAVFRPGMAGCYKFAPVKTLPLPSTAGGGALDSRPSPSAAPRAHGAGAVSLPGMVRWTVDDDTGLISEAGAACALPGSISPRLIQETGNRRTAWRSRRISRRHWMGRRRGGRRSLLASERRRRSISSITCPPVRGAAQHRLTFGKPAAAVRGRARPASEPRRRCAAELLEQGAHGSVAPAG